MNPGVEEVLSTAIPKPWSILIVEDHELTREGLMYALPKNGDFTVVATAENGQKAIQAFTHHQPDLILMDIGLPLMDGIEATRQIKALSKAVKVIILTSHQAPEEVFAALASGADAYCLKDICVERLAQVGELVMKGGVWLDPAIAAMVLNALPVSHSASKLSSNTLVGPLAHDAQDMGSTGSRVKYRTELTERELDVLTEIVNGKSNKEIALALEISLHTVKTHVCNIIQKLSVDDRTQAAIKALREGLV
jgi:DNA-binding NarL/FixJ family response regulator